MRWVDFKHKIGSVQSVREVYNFCREKKLLKKYYSSGNFCDEDFFKGIVFCVDGHVQHGGFADRLFGILQTFALCKIKGLPFKIFYESPFDLKRFWIPNYFDWQIDKSEIVYNRQNALPKVRLGDFNFYKEFPNECKSQIHYYANCWELEKINEFYKTNFSYKELFCELFKNSQFLQDDLDGVKRSLPCRYVSVCFRHQNTFGDFSESAFKPLPNSQKNDLLKRCKNAIEQIRNNYTEDGGV